jgi:hypothetical protein
VASGRQELSARGTAVHSYESFATSDWGIVPTRPLPEGAKPITEIR